MNKSIKKSYALDIVYGVLFVLIFVVLMFFTTNSDGESYFLEQSYRKLFTKYMYVGYVAVIYGLVELIRSAINLHNVDEIVSDIKIEKRRSVNKFVRGATMHVVSWIVFCIFMYFMLDKDEGEFRIYISFGAAVVALILSLIAKGMRKKYIKEKKSAAAAAAVPAANTDVAETPAPAVESAPVADNAEPIIETEQTDFFGESKPIEPTEDTTVDAPAEDSDAAPVNE